MLKCELKSLIARQIEIIENRDAEIKQLIAYKDHLSEENISINKARRITNKDNDDMSMTIAKQDDTIDGMDKAIGQQRMKIEELESIKSGLDYDVEHLSSENDKVFTNIAHEQQLKTRTLKLINNLRYVNCQHDTAMNSTTESCPDNKMHLSQVYLHLEVIEAELRGELKSNI